MEPPHGEPAVTARAFLAELAAALESANVEYMVAGSIVSSLYGEPRNTHDVDVVVRLNSASLAGLLAALDRHRWYVDDADAADVVRRGGAFNIIDTWLGWKADLIMVRPRPFSTMEFSRRRVADVLGVAMPIASAEDAVLSKLEWSLAGGSERQMRDITGIVRQQGDRLDRTYLEHWAGELGVADLLAQVLASG